MKDDIQKSAPKRASQRKSPPVRTPEAQEQRMINLAMKQAEKQLENGTASSQIVTHFLNLATQKAALEREKLAAEAEMARAKAEAIQSQKDYGEKYDRVIAALKSYGLGSGVFGNVDDGEEDYYDD